MSSNLKRPQFVEIRAFTRIGYVLIITKTQVKIHFERQGQNWPGKTLISNFPMKIKVAPFVITNY